VTDTGRVDPSVAGTRAPLDETSNRCWIAWARCCDAPVRSTMHPIATSWSGSGDRGSASNRN
jgi:hypothetical protein